MKFDGFENIPRLSTAEIERTLIAVQTILDHFAVNLQKTEVACHEFEMRINMRRYLHQAISKEYIPTEVILRLIPKGKAVPENAVTFARNLLDTLIQKAFIGREKCLIRQVRNASRIGEA